MLIPLFPLAQVIPLEFGRLQFDTRSAWELARFGVEPPAAASIYPYATLTASVTLAGYCALFALARAMAARSKRSAHLAAISMLVLGFAQAIAGLRQYLRGRTLAEPLAGVAHGTFVNRDHYAALLEGCLGLAIGLAFAFGHRLDRRAWIHDRRAAASAGAAVVGGACLLGVIFSFSRMGIIAAALICLFAAVAPAVRGRARAFCVPALAAAVAAIAWTIGVDGLPGRFLQLLAERGEPARLAIWRDTVRTAADYPWIGAGLGTFAFAFRRSEMYLPSKTIDHAHSDYLEALVELGLPVALLLFGGLWYAILRTGWRMRAEPSGERRILAAGCLLGAGGILVHAAVDFPLRIPAVAALLSVLLGLACGLVPGPSRQRGAPMLAGALAAAGFGLLSLWLFLGGAESRNTESLFARGHAAMMGGRLAEAEKLYIRALGENPRAAVIWLKRAELAEMAGEPGKAMELASVAGRVEPLSLRVEWPTAHLLLRNGQFEEAALGLGRLARAAPEVRVSLFESALKAGMPFELISSHVVPREGAAAGEYLCLLARRREWPHIAPAYRAVVSGTGAVVPPEMLRFVFDKLGEAGEEVEMQRLRELAAGNRGEGLSG